MSTDDPASINDLLQLLDDMDITRRIYARTQLIAIGASIIDTMITVVQSMEGRKCWEAVEVLAEINDPRAIQAVAESLLLPHPLIGHTAARILETHGDEASAHALIEILFRCDPTVQMRVVTALGNMQHKQAIPALMKLLEETPSTTIRYTVIEALIRLDAVESFSLILRYEFDENHHVRERVQMAMRHFGT